MICNADGQECPCYVRLATTFYHARACALPLRLSSRALPLLWDFQRSVEEPTIPAMEFFIRDIECRWISPEKGRGIFAARDLPEGAIVEVSPVAVVPHDETFPACIQKLVLNHYLLYWTDTADAIGFGYLMLYNHGESPTASFTTDYENMCKIVRTRRAVAAGEELTIDYDIPLWFAPATS